MIVYAETSALGAWLFEEPGEDEVRALLASADKVMASRLSLLELERAFVRASVTGRFDAPTIDRLRSLLAEESSRWALLEVDAEVLDLARMRFPLEPLRSLDAIHLGSAMRLRTENRDVVVAALDRRIRENANLLGFEVVP